MKCDIIIPIWNQKDLTAKCIESIKRNTNFPYRLILIDNGSEDATRIYLESLKNDFKEKLLLIRNSENLGWVKAINMGLEKSSSEYVCIQNNDIEVREEWLNKLVEVAESDKNIGLLNPLWDDSKIKHKDDYTEIDYCRGFCMLIKKEVINAIGGLDEIYGLGYYDDWDYSLRAIKAGFKCVRVNKISVIHHKEKSFSLMFDREKWNRLFEKNKAIFYGKWGKPLRFFMVFDVVNYEFDLNEIRDFLNDLLRRQHKVRVLLNRKIDLKITHTNFEEIVFPKGIFALGMMAIIFNNSRRSPDKKYNLIFLNSEKLYKKMSYLKFDKNYKIYADNINRGFFQNIKTYLDSNFERGQEAGII